MLPSVNRCAEKISQEALEARASTREMLQRVGEDIASATVLSHVRARAPVLESVRGETWRPAVVRSPLPLAKDYATPLLPGCLAHARPRRSRTPGRRRPALQGQCLLNFFDA